MNWSFLGSNYLTRGFWGDEAWTIGISRLPISEIIKIRAVQQFPASEGLAFILQLKDVARSVMAEDAAGPAAVDWTGFDRKVDEVALASFDLYSEYRHQVYELRVNEAKRSVSWVLEKMGERDDCAESDEPESSGDLNER